MTIVLVRDIVIPDADIKQVSWKLERNGLIQHGLHYKTVP